MAGITLANVLANLEMLHSGELAVQIGGKEVIGLATIHLSVSPGKVFMVGLQAIAEHLTSAVQPGPDCSERASHHLGDLFVRETLHVGEDDRFPEIGLQRDERPLKRLVQSFEEHGRRRVARQVRNLEPDFAFAAGVWKRLIQRMRLDLRALPQLVDVYVRYDPVQPVLERHLPVVPIEESEGAQKGFLREVLGVCMVARQAVRDVVRLPMAAPNQLVELSTVLARLSNERFAPVHTEPYLPLSRVTGCFRCGVPSPDKLAVKLVQIPRGVTGAVTVFFGERWTLAAVRNASRRLRGSAAGFD